MKNNNFPQQFLDEINELAKLKPTCKSEEDKTRYDAKVCNILSTYGYPFRISKRGEKRADKLRSKYYQGERLTDDELKDASGLLVIRHAQSGEQHLFELVKEMQKEMHRRFNFKFDFPATSGNFTDFLLRRGYIESNPNFVPALLKIQVNNIMEWKNR